MKNKTTVKAVFALCAIVFAFVAPCASADDESATETLDALKAQADMLESRMKMLKPLSQLRHGKYRILYRRAASQLNAVNQQIEELKSVSLGNPIQPTIGVPDHLTIPGRLKEWLENAPEDTEEDEEDGDVDEETDDDDDEDDEPETEPHRRWLEEFLDRKMEGVPDSEQMRALYAAYSEAYSTLKADPACPPDLLVEVSGLCEQLKVAADLESNAAEPPETQDVSGDGTSAESEETDNDGDVTEGDDAEENAGTGKTSTGTDAADGAYALPEDGAGGSSEDGWNGPYIDDPAVEGSAAGAGGGAQVSGETANDDKVPVSSRSDSSKASAGSGSLVNPASGSGAPSKMSQLYGRSVRSGAGATGGSYATAGSYFGSGGTSADASIATNYVDDVPYDLLQWKYGGFKPPTNAVRSTVVVSDLRVNRSGFRFKWVRDIGAWGIPYEVPDALACFFVKNNAGEWVGGKFEWISSSRSAREFTNIRDGYHGWNLKDVPNPCEVAFLVFRKDGKRRSNIVAGVWQR